MDEALEFIIIYAPIWVPIFIAFGVIVFHYLNLAPLLIAEYHQIVGTSFDLVLSTSFFWLPIVLLIVYWETWRQYIRAYYLYKTQWVLLEIKIPSEVTKTPLAMETFLSFLYQTSGETTFIDRMIKGQIRTHFSLEIVSIEGVVKLYIYAEKKNRMLVENGLYAQYQNIEIHEAIDYTKSVHFDPKEMEMFITDYKLNAPHSHPIKTYVDYGLDKEGIDEENKVDPMNTILEYFGSIGPNQQQWLQIIIRAHKKELPFGKWIGFESTKVDNWKDESKVEVEKIRKSALSKDDPTAKFPNPTKGEQERIYKLERKVAKPAFDVGIRSTYFAKKGFYNKSNIGGTKGLFTAYGANDLNSFKPNHWSSKFDYPWQDFRDIRQNRERRMGLEAYKRRCYFYLPYNEGPVIILNVEELASLFHIPGRVTTTPTLVRIPSKKSQSPSNLPI